MVLFCVFTFTHFQRECKFCFFLNFVTDKSFSCFKNGVDKGLLTSTKNKKKSVWYKLQVCTNFSFSDMEALDSQDRCSSTGLVMQGSTSSYENNPLFYVVNFIRAVSSNLMPCRYQCPPLFILQPHYSSVWL